MIKKKKYLYFSLISVPSAIVVGVILFSRSYPHATEKQFGPAVLKALTGFNEIEQPGIESDLGKKIDACEKFLANKGYCSYIGAKLSKKFIRYDKVKNKLIVIFLFDSRQSDDPHCTLIRVEIDENLHCDYTGILES